MKTKIRNLNLRGVKNISVTYRRSAIVKVVFCIWESMMKVRLSDWTTLKNYWKHCLYISAFSNSEGGFLYLGVNDEGEVIGLDNAEKLLETLPIHIGVQQ